MTALLHKPQASLGIANTVSDKENFTAVAFG